MRYLIPIVLLFLVLVSGCTQRTETIQNGNTDNGQNNKTLNETINETANETVYIPTGGFSFKIHGENEFWIPPNKSWIFTVVFNNVDEDGKKHNFIARVHPSAANFDVMAAYLCQHFTLCTSLLNDMKGFIKQPKDPIEINHTFVGLYTIDIEIAEDAVKGTYMYNMVACQDKSFEQCTETQTNWGPNIPIIVHVI
jgi:hypothetical protein